MRDTVIFTAIINDSEKYFEVYIEPTMGESQEIESLMAKLFGGPLELTKIRQRIADYQESLQSVKDVKNAEVSILLRLATSYNKWYIFNKIKVLIKSSDGINLDEISEEDFNIISRAYEVALEPFFRKIKS